MTLIREVRTHRAAARGARADGRGGRAGRRHRARDRDAWRDAAAAHGPDQLGGRPVPAAARTAAARAGRPRWRPTRSRRGAGGRSRRRRSRSASDSGCCSCGPPSAFAPPTGPDSGRTSSRFVQPPSRSASVGWPTSSSGYVDAGNDRLLLPSRRWTSWPWPVRCRLRWPKTIRRWRRPGIDRGSSTRSRAETSPRPPGERARCRSTARSHRAPSPRRSPWTRCASGSPASGIGHSSSPDEALVTAQRHANRRSVTLALTIAALVLAHRGELDRAKECITDARTIFGRGDLHAVSTIDTVAGGNGARFAATPTWRVAILGRSSPVNYFGLLTLSRARATAADRADDPASPGPDRRRGGGRRRTVGDRTRPTRGRTARPGPEPH